MRASLHALLSHWLRNPLQLVTLLTGLALATALWSGVQAINAEARASYDTAADRVGQNRYGRIIAASGRPLTVADFVALRRAGWLVTPQVSGELQTAKGLLTLIGIEPLTAPPLGNMSGMSDGPLDRFFTAPGYAIASADAARMVAALGIPFEVSDALDGAVAIVDIGIAQGLLDKGTTLDRLLVLDAQSPKRADLVLVAPHLIELAPTATGSDIARLTDSFHLNLTAFGMLAFAVGFFIVYGAIGLAFEQRRGMFRSLRAIGVPLRQLVMMLFAELLLFALVGGAVGIVLGYLIAAALLPDVAATLRGLYGASVASAVQIRPEWWLSGLAMAFTGTLIAGAGALWRLSHMPLLDAGTPQAWARQARVMIVRSAILGCGLLCISLVLSQVAQTLVAGFALLGALLIGAALVLPCILDLSLRLLAAHSKTGILHWFWSDTRQQIPGLSMALMALLLAIAANIGVSTMVSSFRLTFTGWLDQRLASELYVTTRDPEQAARLLKLLDGRVQALLPIVSTQARIDGQPGEIYAVADHATYRENWPLLSAVPDVWTKIQKPGYALINEQLALRSDLRNGDLVPDHPDLTIVGVYSDYGNPAPQLIIGLAPFKARYPSLVPLRFGIRLPAEDVPATIDLIKATLDIPDEAMADQARIKAMSLQIFEQTFTVTSALNVLTLGVAGFSILVSLLTLAQMRLPQLAPVWALGVTRRQLGQLELLRAVAMAGLIFALALPLGLALAWALLAIVNVAAFGWRLPMFLFPIAYLWLGGAAMIAAGVAALWPAWRLSRTAPHHMLSVFSAGR